MKINVKLTLAFLIICLVPLIVVTLYIDFITNNTVTRQVLNHLESVASIQYARTHAVIEKYNERLALVSRGTQLRINLDNYLKEKSRSYQEELNKNLVDICSSLTGFQNIDMLNLEGEVLASTNKEKIGTNQAHKECFVRGLVESSVDMLFLDENRNLQVHFSGPIYIEDKLIGVVMIEATTRSIISIVEDYTGLGDSGETLLAKRDENGDALFITPLRFDADAVLNRRVSKEALELPINQALLKNEQLFTDSIDYRGQPVLAATRYIEEADWGLVVKIDKKEAFAPVTNLRNSLVFVIVIASIAILLVSFYTARNITRPISSLTRITTEISGGNLSRRAELKSKDEIGVLAEAFNSMAENLEESYAGLEKKVKQRTVKLKEEVEERKQAEQEVLKSREELRNLASHLQTVREEERTIIARELHDEISQNLAILKIKMYMLGKELPKDKKPVHDGIESLMGITDRMTDTVAKIFTELRPPQLDELGFVGAVKWYRREFEEQTNIKCELHLEPKKLNLSDDSALALFRILQESLTNVRLHSEAERAKVSLREKDGELELTVEDDGIGITEDQILETKSLGIIGMEERVRFLGGEIKIKGIEGKGTTVTVRIPLQVNNPQQSR